MNALLLLKAIYEFLSGGGGVGGLVRTDDGDREQKNSQRTKHNHGRQFHPARFTEFR